LAESTEPEAGLFPPKRICMVSRELDRIRNAVMEGHYALTEHAYEEMGGDDLDVLDVESTILTGKIDQVLTRDSRGTRYVVVGHATNLETEVAVVARFVEYGQLLIITVYALE
jgi:hypothetical protein